MNKTLIVIPSLICTLLAGCTKDRSGENQNSTNSQRELTNLQTIAKANVADDFADAVRRSDLRFVGVYGFATEVPGVPDYFEKFAHTYGLRMIEGTSDCLVDDEDANLNEIARNYAQEYNRLLLKYIKEESLE